MFEQKFFVCAASVRVHLTASTCRKLVRMHALGPVCELMTGSDPTVITVALDTVLNLLKSDKRSSSSSRSKASHTNKMRMADRIEEIGGVDKIEMLLEHENESVAEKAGHLMDVYFTRDDEEDEDADDGILSGSNSTEDWGVADEN